MAVFVSVCVVSFCFSSLLCAGGGISRPPRARGENNTPEPKRVRLCDIRDGVHNTQECVCAYPERGKQIKKRKIREACCVCGCVQYYYIFYVIATLYDYTAPAYIIMYVHTLPLYAYYSVCCMHCAMHRPHKYIFSFVRVALCCVFGLCIVSLFVGAPRCFCVSVFSLLRTTTHLRMHAPIAFATTYAYISKTHESHAVRCRTHI